MNNSLILSIGGEDRWQVTGHPFGLERTDILMVVEADSKSFPGKLQIISAMVVTDPKIIKNYNINKRKSIEQRKRNFEHMQKTFNAIFG